MSGTLLDSQETPRIEDGRALLIAGLTERYTFASGVAIPAQWQRFVPHIGNIPGQIGWTTYGVFYNSAEAGYFEYLCGVEVSDFSKVPEELSRLRIGDHRYAVFEHREHISTVRRTMSTIWNKWLPESGHKPADAPGFELYDQRFNPETGMGGLEIWIPIQR